MFVIGCPVGTAPVAYTQSSITLLHHSLSLKKHTLSLFKRQHSILPSHPPLPSAFNKQKLTVYNYYFYDIDFFFLRC